MAVPVQDGTRRSATSTSRRRCWGWSTTFDPHWLDDALRYAVGERRVASLLVQAANGQMLGLSRLSYSLATNRQIPSAVGQASRERATPYVAIIGRRGARLRRWRCRDDIDFLAGIFAFGAMLAFTLAHLSIDRAALPRAGAAARVPDPAVVHARRRLCCRCRRCSGR